MVDFFFRTNAAAWFHGVFPGSRTQAAPRSRVHVSLKASTRFSHSYSFFKERSVISV